MIAFRGSDADGHLCDPPNIQADLHMLTEKYTVYHSVYVTHMKFQGYFSYFQGFQLIRSM